MKANNETAQKRTVAVSADCSCDLPSEVLAENGISTISYYIKTDSGEFRDGTEITGENLVEYIKQGRAEVTTTPPDVEEYVQYFSGLLEKHSQVVHITLTSHLTKSYANAVAAAERLGGVFVVDSRHVSGGIGLIALKAAKLSATGMEGSQIASTLREEIPRICSTFVLRDATSIQKSERQIRLIARFCNLFGICPTVVMRGGQYSTGSLYLNPLRNDNYYDDYITKLMRGAKDAEDDVVLLTTIGLSAAQVRHVCEKIAEFDIFCKVLLLRCTASIACHGGNGTFGISFLRKKHID